MHRHYALFVRGSMAVPGSLPVYCPTRAEGSFVDCQAVARYLSARGIRLIMAEVV
jgi:hypothetical protein